MWRMNSLTYCFLKFVSEIEIFTYKLPVFLNSEFYFSKKFNGKNIEYEKFYSFHVINPFENRMQSTKQFLNI